MDTLRIIGACFGVVLYFGVSIIMGLISVAIPVFVILWIAKGLGLL